MAKIIFKGQQSIDAKKVSECDFMTFKKATRVMLSEIKDELLNVMKNDKENKFIFQYALLQLEDEDVKLVKKAEKEKDYATNPRC